MKIISVVGARPQFIKVAPILRAITAYNTENSEGIEHLLVHTGQHYDYEMSQAFFVDLDIPAPDYNLQVGSGIHGAQTGDMLKGIEAVLLEEKPDLVLVYGDTNSTLAAALAAVKLHLPVAHVEAGLRDYDKKIPEEVNRLLTDHVSTLLFCPSRTGVENLRQEGYQNIAWGGELAPLEQGDDFPSFGLNHPLVINTGDVMVDALLHNMELAEEHSKILDQLNLEPNESKNLEGYALATVHRAENTDDPERLQFIFAALGQLSSGGVPVVIPLHPRTRKVLAKLPQAANLLKGLQIIPPVPYKDMLVLERHAQVVLTDSGGVQKEAFLLRVPCVTMNRTSGWVETVESGLNKLVGADKEKILSAAHVFLRDGPPKVDATPYGDGHAAERIVNILAKGITVGDNRLL